MKRRCPRFTMCANCRNLAWALGPLLAGLLIAASTASADTAVVGLSPKVARPGERVDLRVVCGACRRADTSFPISLVPVAKAPPPHPCRVKLKGHMETGLCSPTAVRPPSERPFVLLGSTSRGRRALPAGSWPPGSNSDLRFAVPEIEPGRYAFVIFCAECGRRSRGSLIADTSLPGKLLRIQPSEASVRTAGGGADPTWWIVAGIGTVALVLAAGLLLRRRQAV
jgi:hypothetical protein